MWLKLETESFALSNEDMNANMCVDAAFLCEHRQTSTTEESVMVSKPANVKALSVHFQCHG